MNFYPLLGWEEKRWKGKKFSKNFKFLSYKSQPKFKIFFSFSPFFLLPSKALMFLSRNYGKRKLFHKKKTKARAHDSITCKVLWFFLGAKETPKRQQQQHWLMSERVSKNDKIRRRLRLASSLAFVFWRFPHFPIHSGRMQPKTPRKVKHQPVT